jgi:uncharacterized RDD family membrane protein YckC
MAYVLDCLLMIPGAVLCVISVLNSPHETVVSGSGVVITSTGDPGGLFWAGLLLSLMLFAGSRVLMQGLTGRSLGKRLFGLRVVRDNDESRSPGVGRAAIRFLLELLGWVDLIVVLASKRHRRMGDMAMKTVVVRDPLAV